MFQKDQNSFFKKLEGTYVREGDMTNMKKNETTPKMLWMKEVKQVLSEKVSQIEEFKTELRYEKKRRKKKLDSSWN